jgi:hypothetical protein
MIKYLLAASASVNASICGCGGCSIDWLETGNRKTIILGLGCEEFDELMGMAQPAIKLSQG